MAELGDLGDFLKEGGVTNLDWLDVPNGPREPLPRQNLDIIPDLEQAWSHTDKPVSAFVPNTGDAPRTMGDMSKVHGPLRMEPLELVRTARLAMMQTPMDPNRIAHALTSRFDRDSISAAKTALSQVFAERGLLGGYYLAAADFPGCSKGTDRHSKFVRRFAPEARFLLAKAECRDCIHLQAGRCGVFHKQIVMEVPYTEELADSVEKAQAAKGIKLASSKDIVPKQRIRLAILGKTHQQPTGFTGRFQEKPKGANVRTASKGQALATAGQIAIENEQSAQQKLAVAKARPVVNMLHREMLKGRSEQDLLDAMRLAFDAKFLQETRPQWEPTFKEAGLYGAVYMHQTDFEDCRVGADFVSRHGSKLRSIVAGDKCASCIFSQVGRCLMYGRKLVASPEEVLTPETVIAVLNEYKLAGKLSPAVVKQDWGNTPVKALKALYKAATTLQPTAVGDIRSVVERAFYGGTPQRITSSVTKRDIVKAASQYLNEGLYGEELGRVLRGRFEITDLKAAREELKLVIAEQGLQGIKYIDPTVYDDYGSGCATAGRLHRSRSAVRYARVGPKCANCVHQTMPGTCSVLAKQLVVEPPYVNKTEEQKAVLASGKSTEVRYADLIQNGLTAIQEFQLQNGGDIELNPEGVDPEVTIEFGAHEVKLP